MNIKHISFNNPILSLTMMLLLFAFVVTALCQGNCNNLDCYETERDTLVALDEQYLIGNNVNLTANEMVVESLLFSLRDEMIEKFFDPPLPQRNWRNLVDVVKTMPLYKLMESFPKGAALHVHGFCNSRVSIKTGTYDPTCYVDLRPNSNTFGFFQYSSTSVPGWANTVIARSASSNVKSFDDMLWNFTQFWTAPLSTNETEMWLNFNKVIGRTNSLLSKDTVMNNCLIDTFSRLEKHGIQHLELRIPLNVDLIDQVSYMLNQYNEKTGSNLTVRYIIEHTRNKASSNDVYPTMQKALWLMQNNSWVVGFDLVGEEDMGLTLHDYAPDFIKIRNYAISNGLPPLPFVFHCAETDNVTHSSSNTFDAILLDSIRLGHALGLRNHPAMMKIVKNSNIGLEICPVSNQLLRYFSDIRTHPGSQYVAKGLPVTLNSDDPDIYNYDSPSPVPDFFMAFLSWDLTLAALKQIAENSITASTLDATTKQQKLVEYQRLYSDWINQVAQRAKR
jgi:adenosine deaminase-related growth factor